MATEKADLAEPSKSLVSLKASQAASQSTCSQMALDHETSVKAFAEELKTFAEATQVIQDQTGRAKKQTYLFTVPRKFICWLADEHRTQRIQSGDHGEEARQEGALSE